MKYEDALAVIQQDLASGKITKEEADFAKKWLDETVKQATALKQKRDAGFTGRIWDEDSERYI